MRRRAPPWLLLEVHVGQRVSALIANDEAGVGLLDGPRRREAARGTCGSGSYFQTATAKLIYCLGTRLGFILSVYGDLRRQVAELITDVPAVIGA